MPDKQYDNFNKEHIKARWQNYLDNIKIVHPLLLKAIEIVDSKNIELKSALDIGCGPGNEVNFLIKNRNINTIALDYNKECLNKISSNFPDLINNPLFSFEHARIENFEWKQTDLMISLKVLPFLDKHIYLKILENVKNNLSPNGVFVASVFGEDDEWKDLQLCSSADIKNNFKGFKELYFKEQKGKGKTASGKIKKMHLIDFIYQKQ